MSCAFSKLILKRYLVVFLILFGTTRLVAHPMGNFSVNRHTWLEVFPDKIQILYTLDLAEIPTFQEKAKMDAGGKGIITENEKEAWGMAKSQEIASNLELKINGKALRFKPVSAKVTFSPGTGDMSTLLLMSVMETKPGAMVPAMTGGVQSAIFHDNNEPGRIGWRDITIEGDGTTILAQSTGRTDRTNGLRNYSRDDVQNPMDVRSADFTFSLSGSNKSSASNDGQTAGNAPPKDYFATLIAYGALTPARFALFLLIAAGLGAVHGLSPGHGKTLVAAYLIGSRGTPRHALLLGLIVTITHTAGVFALGLVTLFASKYLLPETLYPWLSAVSGLAITSIGLAKLFGLSGFNHDHSHGHGHSHSHHHGEPASGSHGYENFRFLDSGNKAHGHSHGYLYAAADHPHDHEHGHSHLPAPGSPITFKSLLSLGISGGMIPCPSALVVLLSAVSLHRIGFGLVLILAFSAGLAGVLTGIGVLMVTARDLFNKRITLPVHFIQLVPKMGAIVVACIGAGIMVPAILTLLKR